MPTYVYRRADGTTFEVTQRISDDALTKDPETGEPVERVIGGGAGLIFKGSGFYVTDYVRNSGGDTSSDASGSAPKDSASDAKPEKKSGATSGTTESTSKTSDA